MSLRNSPKHRERRALRAQERVHLEPPKERTRVEETLDPKKASEKALRDFVEMWRVESLLDVFDHWTGAWSFLRDADNFKGVDDFKELVWYAEQTLLEKLRSNINIAREFFSKKPDGRLKKTMPNYSTLIEIGHALLMADALIEQGSETREAKILRGYYSARVTYKKRGQAERVQRNIHWFDIYYEMTLNEVEMMARSAIQREGLHNFGLEIESGQMGQRVDFVLLNNLEQPISQTATMTVDSNGHRVRKSREIIHPEWLKELEVA